MNERVQHALRDDVTLLKNGIVVPQQAGSAKELIQKAGIFSSDGKFIENSITQRSERDFNQQPEFPKEDLEMLPGRWLYVGPYFSQFGHFYIESLSRIWALNQIEEKIDGLLFLPKRASANPQDQLDTRAGWLGILGYDGDARILMEPTQVEQLYVPSMGIGIDEYLVGSGAHQSFIKENFGQGIRAEGADRIYISRFDLYDKASSYIGEGHFQRFLRDEGYTVIHPQKMTMAEQIAQYRAAKDVIAADGSALHLLAFAGHQQQRAAIIARRSMAWKDTFTHHIQAYSGAMAQTHYAIKQEWIPQKDSAPSSKSWGEIDFGSLCHSLRGQGMITGHFDALSDDVVAEEIAAIGRMQKTEFKSWVQG